MKPGETLRTANAKTVRVGTMTSSRPALRDRKVGEGNYTKDRKAWADSWTLEELAAVKESDSDALKALEESRAKKRRRKNT